MRNIRIAVLFPLLLQVYPVQGQVWKTMFDAADSLSARKLNDSALVIGTRAFQIVRAELPKRDTLLAYALQKVGRYSLLAGRPAEGKSAYEAALKIREELQGEFHLDLTNILLPLGKCYLQVDELRKAGAAFMRDIDIVERSEGSESPLLEKPMMDLANVWSGMGRYSEAENLELRLLRLRQRTYGEMDPSVSASYLNMGSHWLDEGKLVAAEQATHRVLEILEKANRPKDDKIAMALNNLGEVCFEEGRFAEAERFFNRALALKEEIFGPTGLYNVSTLNNLGKLYLDQGDHTKAEHYFLRAFAAVKKNFGLTHSSAILSILRLGEFYSLSKRFAQGDSLLSLAETLVERTYGTTTHPHFASVLGYRAESRLRQQDYASAESLSKEAVRIHEETLGRGTLRFAESTELYARCLRVRGKVENSLAAFREAFDTRNHIAMNSYAVMSERNALSSARALKRLADYNLTLICDDRQRGEELAKEATRIVLREKGQVWEATNERRTLALSERDSSLRALIADWRAVQSRISSIYAGELVESSIERTRTKIDSLTAVANDLESLLARRSAGFRARKDHHEVTIGSIASILPGDSPLVEYFKFDYRGANGETREPYYVAIVLNKDGRPIFRNLGKAHKIDRLVEQYRVYFHTLALRRSAPTRVDQKTYASLTSQLYSLIWKPISHFLPKKGIIFVSPDAGLNLISFAGLMDNRGRYLIQDHAIHYLTAGRDLIRILEDSTASGRGVLAMGDPDYDATAARRLSGVETMALNITLRTQPSGLRNVRSSCEALNEIEVPRLPNTRAEVRQVADYFGKSHILTAAGASEENFKKYAPGSNVVHVATHGYFISGECGQEHRTLNENVGSENPLLQSGLLLAGANLHGRDADSAGAQDGVLTALEVSGMTLRGTDLVVLSACETGLGKVEQGEGVYGLRRAFQMAGARTVVSSLWQVPDDETMKFMKTLYSTNAGTYPELMQQVALKRIREARLRGRPTHPFTWGAFIATGDWRIR